MITLVYMALPDTDITRCGCRCFTARLVRSPVNRFLIDVHETHADRCVEALERMDTDGTWQWTRQDPDQPR